MNKADREYLGRAAALGCIACYIQGTPGTPAEIHHPRAGTGAGRRAPHSQGIPLCPPHHRGTMHPQIPSIHLDKQNFIDRFGDEQSLVRLTHQLVDASEVV